MAYFNSGQSSDEWIERVKTMFRHMVNQRSLSIIRKAYIDAGFEIDIKGELRRGQFIDVICKEAKIDEDFYCRGDIHD